MLKNYFKIAIAVLKRRKFFTFISLFGISFTLMVLIVATAFVDNITGPGYPELDRNRMLYIISVEQKNTEKDYSMMGPMSLSYISKYIATMKTPAKVAISSMFSPTNTYVNNKKLVIDMNFTNAAFWEVMRFDFLEGRPYTQQQVDNNEKVTVITENTRREYFGDLPGVAGRYIEADNVKYKVLGVVKNVPVTKLVSYADMYVPYTAKKGNYKTQDYNGSFMATLLANSEDDLDKIKKEYASIVSKIPPRDKEMNLIKSSAGTFLGTAIRNSPLGGGDDGTSMVKLYSVIALFALLFMLLPTLNLVNINISRIMERSSEIGVRKAFGASASTLTGQFIVENLLLTFLGTLIGLLLSFLVLGYINNAGLIQHIHLSINFAVLAYSILACVVFGLLSGVYPAWRMSRMQIVSALKA